MKKSIFLAFVVFSIYQCGSPEPECLFGEPRPIFSSDDEGLKQYSYSRDGQESSELFTLLSGQEVEIYQSGCDNVRQEYRFSSALNEAILHQDSTYHQDSIVVLEAAKGFLALSEIADDPVSFGQYAQILSQNARILPEGYMAGIEPGFAIGVYFVPMGQTSVVQVVMASFTPEEE